VYAHWLAVELSAATRHDNARFFADRFTDVPTRAITQGLGAISRARSIVLAVRGANKARALWATLNGPITSAVPASILKGHPAVTVIADRTAAFLLPSPEEDR
jgi:glucosamine-6-phosphate deaminase